MLFLQGCSSAARFRLDPKFDARVFDSIHAQTRSGDFSSALAESRTAFEAWRSSPNAEWHWRFRLLYAELLLLNGETRKANDLLVASPPPALYGLLPRRRMLQGYVAYREGKGVGARALLTGAAAQAHAAGDFELETDAKLTLATYASGDDPGTEELIDGIVRLAGEHGFSYQLAAALVDFGMLRVQQSRFAEAIPYFDRASQTAVQAQAALLSSIALGDMATCFYNLGDFEQAASLRMRAIAIQQRAGLQTPLRDSYLELGISQSLQGENVQAAANLRKALGLTSAADSPKRYALIATSLAASLQNLGALDEASQLNAAARKSAGVADADIPALVLSSNAGIAERRGNHEEAIAMYNKAIALSETVPSRLWPAQAALGSVYFHLGRAAEARASFDAAIRTIEASRAEQLQSQYKITFLTPLIRLYQEYVDLLVRQGDTARALEVADSSRAAVLTGDLTGIRSMPQGAVLSKVQSLSRQTSSVFLFYWMAPDRSFLWVFERGNMHLVVLADGKLIAQQVRSYRYLVEREKTDPLLASHHGATQLFDELVAPARQWIAQNASVVIVPDDALHELNFETLITGDPPHYWLEDVTVSVAPSLAVLQSDPPVKRRPASLLLVGDPVNAGTGYPPLPDAAAEIERVRSHFPARAVELLRGAAAVPSAYSAARPQLYSTIHFTAHADANERSPLDSAIILSPSAGAFRLYARDIMEQPVTAQLVTISACRGAGARALSGEGLVGFEWAFFKAGAKNVLAGLWDVNDRATSNLMDSFYSGVDEGLNYAQALRRAKLALIAGGARKPYFWAPFQLYSRGVQPARK